MPKRPAPSLSAKNPAAVFERLRRIATNPRNSSQLIPTSDHETAAWFTPISWDYEIECIKESRPSAQLMQIAILKTHRIANGDITGYSPVLRITKISSDEGNVLQTTLSSRAELEAIDKVRRAYRGAKAARAAISAQSQASP